MEIEVNIFPGSGKLEPIADVEHIFDNAKIEKHSDYYLQTFLYGVIVSNSVEYNPAQSKVSPALFFVQRSSQDNYDPTLQFGKTPIDDVKTWNAEFIHLLEEVINEIFSPAVPFRPTATTTRCDRCPFAALCNS